MKKAKSILGIFLALMAVTLLVPVQALAAGNIDLNHDKTMTISYRDSNVLLSGAKFSIYLVATVDENGELTVTEDFAQFNVNIRGKDDAAWKTLASTLEGYVLRDNVTPADRGKTDSLGQVSFPTGGNKLTAGLYLVLGSRHSQQGTIYDAQPFMVLLPSLDKEENDWIYDVIVRPKFDKRDEPGGSDDTITRKVLKVWKDDGHEKDRPKEVIVQLLRDGKVYETVTLNKANNWRHTWNNLNDSYKWTIVEKELDDYTVEVIREGITFVVTNTYTDDIPDNPSPSDSTTPNDPTLPNTDKPALPQTGQFWWPVPVLLAAGLLLIIAGLLRCRGAENEK